MLRVTISILALIVFLILIGMVISCIRIVRQAQALVIERLGAYQATWGTGLHVKLPIVDRVARRVDLKEQVVDFAPQPVITKDNVTMRIRLYFIRLQIRRCSVTVLRIRLWRSRT